MGAWTRRGFLIAAFVVSFLTFLPTVGYQFLNWDDTIYVLENPWIREFSARNLAYIFTHPYSANYLPLHLLSYLGDHRIWGLNPFGYHLHSVALNALNGALAFLVIERLSRSVTIAGVAALLFAVHHSHVEAVAWISSRKELLSATFLLLSLLCYTRAGGGNENLRWRPYILSVLLFTLALLSKVTVVVLPLFLVVLGVYEAREGRIPVRRLGTVLVRQLPYVVLGVCLALVNSRAQVRAHAAYAENALDYAAVKGQAVWNYVAVLAGISPGQPLYDLPESTGNPVLAAGRLAGLLVLPVMIAVAYLRRSRIVTLALSWIFVLLIPALLFPLVTYMADRYLYLPSLGFCWILAAGIVTLPSRASWPGRRAITTGAAALLMGFFLLRTGQYSPVFRDSEALWTYAIQHSLDFRGYNNLAAVRMSQRRWKEAERLLLMGARAENSWSYRNLGALYYNTGRYEEALEASDRALSIIRTHGGTPQELAAVHFNRGAVLWALGRRGEAIAAWNATLQADPSHREAQRSLDHARAAPPATRADPLMPPPARPR